MSNEEEASPEASTEAPPGVDDKFVGEEKAAEAEEGVLAEWDKPGAGCRPCWYVTFLMIDDLVTSWSTSMHRIGLTFIFHSHTRSSNSTCCPRSLPFLCIDYEQ